MNRSVGLDFGTTNSVLALLDERGDALLVRFDSGAGAVDTFRSILFFEHDEERPGREAIVHAGPRAIERYVAREGQGRLIQSVKSFLASRTFTETTIGNQRYRLEHLIALIVGEMRRQAEGSIGDLGTRLVVGRPVRFAGEDSPSHTRLAEARLRAALANASFAETRFVLEPVAAAYHYERRLHRDEVLLIADFGGGTSDFSVLNVGPSFRDTASAESRILAVGGVPVAGDTFDARIVRHAVSPLLGLGTQYRTANKRLPIPVWLYGHLERWHLLSMLKSPRNIRLLEQLRYQAVEPDRLDALLHLVTNDLGFDLYQAVNAAKAELSSCEEASLRFSAPPVHLDLRLRRSDFEAWIEPDLRRIADCVDGTVAQAGLDAGRIDRVFMTGGSSFVPAVRRIFAERFGAGRLDYGDEFVSVARGLALAARDLLR